MVKIDTLPQFVIMHTAFAITAKKMMTNEETDDDEEEEERGGQAHEMDRDRE